MNTKKTPDIARRLLVDTIKETATTHFAKNRTTNEDRQKDTRERDKLLQDRAQLRELQGVLGSAAAGISNAGSRTLGNGGEGIERINEQLKNITKKSSRPPPDITRSTVNHLCTNYTKHSGRERQQQCGESAGCSLAHEQDRRHGPTTAQWLAGPKYKNGWRQWPNRDLKEDMQPST